MKLCVRAWPDLGDLLDSLGPVCVSSGRTPNPRKIVCVHNIYMYNFIDMGYSGTMMMMMMVLLACLVGRSVVCLFVCSFIILEQYRVVGPSAFFDNKLLDGLLMCVDALLQV